ncbi:MAG: DoxX family membrane protein [Propioniciclava sp.]|uniref:MauE/DoxX family redox-associated membrane protein n=1 Tax=Propioniciclava sp. TaxID=2038686 RepID=UPI0039E487AD
MPVAPTFAGRPVRDWIGLLARLLLGGVLLVAGGLKVGALGESVVAVRAYLILPYEITAFVGYALPLGEIALGLLLISGLFTRLSAALGGLLMLAFAAAIISVWARGISLDCGCFGGGGVIDPETAFAAYPWEIARDIGLAAAGAWLVFFPRTPYSVDGALSAASPASGLSPHTDHPAAEELETR